MIELEDEAAEGHQKTQIYDKSIDEDSMKGGAKPAMLSNLFESSALQYEKVQQMPLSHENTFIREEADSSSMAAEEQIKLFPTRLLQQLMLNSEQILNQKIGSK